MINHKKHPVKGKFAHTAKTTRTHHTAQGTLAVTSYGGAPIPDLLPAEWAAVHWDMQLLKLIGRARCPGCAAWFNNPTHFGLHAQGDDIFVFATCPACTVAALQSEAATQALLDRVGRFLDGAK
jgi:hypothetical protein